MYGYIRLPYIKVKKPERNQKEEQSIMGSLKSVVTGDLSDVDSVFSQISKGVSFLGSVDAKFSVVAMTQLMSDGQVSSDDALNYLCTGLAPQLGFTSAALGYQSMDAMKAALKSGTINSGQFFSSLGNFTELLAEQEAVRDINREEVIFLDLVLKESFTKAAETAERRVEKGQPLSSFIHNLPPTGELVCQFIEGVNYTQDEFNWQLDYLREKYVQITLQLGDDAFSGYVLTNYTYDKDKPANGFEYRLNFKHISVGTVETKKINIRELDSKYQQVANIVKNPVDAKAAEKTETKSNIGGVKEIYADVKSAYDDFMNNN